jgi:hypothetical protein
MEITIDFVVLLITVFENNLLNVTHSCIQEEERIRILKI